MAPFQFKYSSDGDGDGGKESIWSGISCALHYNLAAKIIMGNEMKFKRLSSRALHQHFIFIRFVRLLWLSPLLWPCQMSVFQFPFVHSQSCFRWSKYICICQCVFQTLFTFAIIFCQLHVWMQKLNLIKIFVRVHKWNSTVKVSHFFLYFINNKNVNNIGGFHGNDFERWKKRRILLNGSLNDIRFYNESTFLS